jgi:N6-adenosine-specific RNA methylase IME4
MDVAGISNYTDATGRSVRDIAHTASVLFLWATSPLLPEAVQVMDAWGFDYKTNMVWDKGSIGMGYYARQQHELLLIGTRGTPGTPLPEARPPSVICESKGKLSAKPERFYEIIEAMYPAASKVELFCRSPREGWEVWGNEV